MKQEIIKSHHKLKQTKSATTLIKRSPSWQFVDLREIWEYRELLYFLIWRTVKVRYKQTALGASWALIQPVFTMIVFSLFFGKLAKIPSDGIPYPIFTYTALVPWIYFANSVAQSATSLVDNQHMISKVYFPRLIIPLATVLSGLFDFAIAFSVLIAMMFYYGIFPTINILALPFVTFIIIATAFSAGVWLSALNVEYRDIKYVVPFIVQFWLFASPVAYPVSLVPERWRAIYGINPMAGVIEGFRWMLLGQEAPGAILWVSVFVVALTAFGGLIYFRHMEKSFADIV